MKTQAAKLELISPNGMRETLDIDGDITIGRADTNRVALDDAGASRNHAVVQWGDGRFMVRDLGSRNGTYVNHDRIVERALEHGDVIRIGTHELRFMCPNPLQLFTNGLGEQSIVQKAIDAQSYNVAQELLHAQSKTQNQRLYRHLRTLQDIGNAIGTILQLDELLGKILDHIFATFAQADKGFILLKDGDDDDELVPRASKARDGEASSSDVTVSSTLMREVMDKKRSILSYDAQSEFQGVASILDHDIRSVVCVPLVCQDEALGVIHLHSTGRLGAFQEEDLQLLTSIGNQAAICVKNAQLYAQIEHETRIRQDFQRYVSPGLAEQIVQKKIAVELGGHHRTGTIFFADIVGFTPLAETRDPHDVVTLLNHYFRRMVEIIFRYEGTVDKFGGDAIMAVWGVPVEVEDGAFKAIASGIAMQTAVFQLNTYLTATQGIAIGMGVGINSGRFLAGNIGSEERLEYTIIGDAVNMASRVESRAAGGQVLATEASYREVASRVVAVKLPPTRVKGKDEPVALYSIRGVASPEPPSGETVDLALPVTYAAEDDREEVALITKAERRSEGGFIMQVLCRNQLSEGETVTFVPRLEEVPDLPAMVCQISACTAVEADETTQLYQASLELAEPDGALLPLLQTGAPVQSPLESVEGLREVASQVS